MPFYKDIRNGNADDNKRIDQSAGYYYYFSYMDDGHLDVFIRNCLRFGIYPGLTFYNVNNGTDSPQAFYNGLNDTTWLKTYYAGLKNLIKYCNSIMLGVPLTLTLEPDMLGYLKLDYGATYLSNSFYCGTQSAYSTGVLNSSDPTFANNLSGFCKSINYVIKKYMPNASVGWAFPEWACTHNVDKGIMHAIDYGYEFNPTGNYSTGRNLIREDYVELSSISISLGLNYLTDWIAIEDYGYDGAIDQNGGNSTNWTNPGTTDWFWNAQYYDNLMLAAKTMNASIADSGTGLPIVLQGQGGHINHSLMQSPTIYNSSNTFPDLSNSGFQWEDAASDYFFGDTMTVSSGNRLTYFGTKPVEDSMSVIVNGNTVIWQEHITKAKNNGVVAIQFNPGMTQDTHDLPDPGTTTPSTPSDNYWWITKVQRYYLNPVMK